MSRIIECKYECGTRLGEFDQDAHKYKEIDTGEIHTYERCQAAKAKKTRVGILLEQKDDHGNELVQPLRPEGDALAKPPYVDHTAAGIPQIITVIGDTAEEMDDLANSWLKRTHGKIRFKGGQRVNTREQYEITFYYEELKQ
jgi:hypothetical protein